MLHKMLPRTDINKKIHLNKFTYACKNNYLHQYIMRFIAFQNKLQLLGQKKQIHPSYMMLKKPKIVN